MLLSLDVISRFLNAVLLSEWLSCLVKAALQRRVDVVQSTKAIQTEVVCSSPCENAKGSHLARDHIGEGPVPQEEGSLCVLDLILGALVQSDELLSQ